jgi:hypothetical protein
MIRLLYAPGRRIVTNYNVTPKHKVSSRHDSAMMQSMKNKHIKIPLFASLAWVGVSLAPFILTDQWALVWFPLNLPLSAVFQFGGLRSLGNVGYAAIVTLLNATVLFCVIFCFLKPKKKLRNEQGH